MEYRVEAAPSGRSHCRGPRPCTGSLIGYGELRLGILVQFYEKSSFVYRHWKCVTQRQMESILSKYAGPEDIPGFEDLCDEHKLAVLDTFDNFEVPDYEIYAVPQTPKKKARSDPDVANPDAVEQAFGDQEDDAIGTDSQPIPPKKKRAAPSRAKKGKSTGKGKGRKRQYDSDDLVNSDFSDVDAMKNEHSPTNRNPDFIEPYTLNKQQQDADEDFEPVASTSRYQTRSQTKKQNQKRKSPSVKVEMSNRDYAYAENYKRRML